MKRTVLSLVFVVAVATIFLIFQRYSAAEKGEREFARLGCTGCHFSGAGPNLTHVAAKHDAKLLERFIQNPQAVYAERNGRPLNDGYMLMPKLQVSEEQAKWIVAYLKELDKQ